MLNIKNLLKLMAVGVVFTACSNEKTEQIGAYKMPYVRYDSQEAIIGGGAERYSAPDFDRTKTASEASNQEYVALKTIDDFVSWEIKNAANGITVRFTLPDNETGESVGQRSDINIFINGKNVKTVTLNSYWAWQYFVEGVSEPKAEINNYPMMRFDEVHFLLDEKINVGDVLKITKTANDNLECGIDFIEIEDVSAPIKKPENALSVMDFGAKGDGVTDDYAAFIKCIETANETGKTVYIPAGTFRIDALLKLDFDNTNIQGAGMWHTNLYFGNDNFRSGAICGNASNIRISDVYINGKNNRRLGLKDKDGNFVYTCNYGWNNHVLYQDQKGICGNFGNNSVIENVWVEHFECGIWVAPYAWVEGKEMLWTTPEGFVLDSCGAEAEKERTTNLRVSNVRLRNQYADGVNFSEGTSFSVFEHSNVRNCGDDGIASWSQKDAGKKTPPNRGNIFRFNTVELGWRAGAIGIFGGSGHQIYNCYVGEHILSAGIRFTADFPGHPLDTNPENAMTVKNCVIYKCGTKADLFNNWLGAIDIHGSTRYPLNNIWFENIKIINPQTEGIHIWSGNINNITFKNVDIQGSAEGINDISVVVDEWQKQQFGFEKQSGSALFINTTHTKTYKNNDDFVWRFE